MFKELKNGDVIHMVDNDPNTGIPSLIAATVEEVMPERVKGTTKVIDIKVNLNGGVRPIENLEPMSNFAHAGRYKIYTLKSRALDEVRNVYDANILKIKSVSDYKKVADICKSILEENGQSVETDKEKFEKLSSRVDGMETNIKEILTLLKDGKTNNTPARPRGGNKGGSEQPQGAEEPQS